MAGFVSKWTKKGSNFDGVDDGDALFKGYANPGDTSTGETGGTAANNVRYAMDVHSRHECHVWLADDGTTYTEPFDFPVTGDLTITLNATKLNLGNAPGDCTVIMHGGCTDNTNTDVVLDSLGTGTLDNVIQTYVYDYDANGRAPFMRLSINQTNDVDNTSQPIKVVVTGH